MAAERLQKLLSHAGIASRRAAEEMIVAGRVTVNGAVVTRLGERADLERDDVRVDGQRLRPAKPLYLALHKPTAVMTTLDDPEGRKTVLDLLPRDLPRVFPVGRLDFQTSGLLLLTNDGELAARLLHPRARIPRTYRVKVDGHPDARALGRLRKGVRLEDGVTAPAQVDVEETRSGKTWLRITIREGKHREVRRMCEAVGHLVDKLSRVRFGLIDLGTLPPGAWRELAPREVEALKRAAGLAGEVRRARSKWAKPKPAKPKPPRAGRARSAKGSKSPAAPGAKARSAGGPKRGAPSPRGRTRRETPG